MEVDDLFYVKLVGGMLQQLHCSTMQQTLCSTMLTMALTFLQACALCSGGCYLRLP